jgi:hypothetical protein
MWCAHSEHGGNGRFWRVSEVEEGWYDPSKPPVVSEAYQAKLNEAHERSVSWTEEIKRKATEGRKRRMTDATSEKTPKAGKEPKECLCGCKGMTKGGTFLPGHDARYHAAQKREAAGNQPEPIKTKPAKQPKAAKAKAPDLTARATDEPAETGDIEV